MLELKNAKLEDIVSWNQNLFAELKDQEPSKIHLLSVETIADIKKRISESESADSNKRTGGKTLKTLVESLAVQRERYDSTLEKIQDILIPKEKKSVSQSVNEALALAQERSIDAIARSYFGIPDKTLRIIAQNVLGDFQIDCIYEELPRAMARKQLGI